MHTVPEGAALETWVETWDHLSGRALRQIEQSARRLDQRVAQFMWAFGMIHHADQSIGRLACAERWDLDLAASPAAGIETLALLALSEPEAC